MNLNMPSSKAAKRFENGKGITDKGFKPLKNTGMGIEELHYPYKQEK